MKVGKSGVHTGWLHARVQSRVSKGEKHRWPTRVEHKPCTQAVCEGRGTHLDTESNTVWGHAQNPSRVRGSEKKEKHKF